MNPFAPERRIIIGITGKKGAGKSTVAEFIEDEYDFHEYAFADALKSACLLIFQLQARQLYGSQNDKESIDEYWGVSPRVIMQEFGTAMRSIAARNARLDKIWIRGLHREIINKDPNRVIISDVRYQDEADSIKEYETRGWTAIIIKIIRDEAATGMQRKKRHPENPETNSSVETAEISSITNTDLHESEMQEVKYDYLVENASTRRDLFAKIKKIMDEVNKK